MRVTTDVRSSTVGAGREHRGDIDGLRAVAILLVVGFHAGLSWLPGGFVGVDVFFVISGYLISGRLLSETGRSGTVDLLAFWGKRIRRLVPALALMLVGAFVLAIAILNPLEWEAVADEGRAAALYVSNIYFAEHATDYFAADIGNSLFLHTWSLGVEEQFYLVWPLFFAAACLLVRARSTRRTVIVAGFAIVLVASFGLSMWLTERGSPWAFFSLPTRAWEFAVAGLLAAIPVPEAVRRRGVATAAAATGLVLVVVAALVYNDTTPYPGYRAVLPVAGTVLVILAGAGVNEATRNPVSATLAARPAQWIGRVSYSWYLWHWPLILLGVAWLDDDALGVTLGAALVSLAVAAVAFHVIENPVRFSRTLISSRPRTYALGAGITATVLLASVGVVQYAEGQIGDGELADLDDVRAARRVFDCPNERTSDDGIEYCEAGDPDGDSLVFLIGDSHTRHWAPAFIEAAERDGRRLVIRWRGACPSTNVPVVSPGVRQGGDPIDGDCTTYQRDTDALIDDLDPDVVVLANSATYVVPVGQKGRTQPDVWAEGLRDRIESLHADGRAVAIVKDTPRLPDDPIPCLAEADDPAECAVPRDEAVHPRGLALLEAEERVVDEAGDVAHLDVNPLLCPDDVCAMQIDGIYVYTDTEHLYDGFARTLAPQASALVDEALSMRPRED